MVVGAGIDGGHPLLAGQGAVDEGLVEEWNEENNYFEIALREIEEGRVELLRPWTAEEGKSRAIPAASDKEEEEA